MRYASNAEPGRARGVACVTWLVAAAWASGAAHGAASQLTVQGLQDLTAIETDDDSRALSRNEGDAAGIGRLRLWVGGELVPGLTGLVLGEVEGGDGTPAGQTEAQIEQAFLRYTLARGPGLMVDAGKISCPFGNFSDRTFSNVNPLIGAPDGYDVSYPLGLVITGKVTRLDYRVAALDGPMTNESYVPPAGNAWRPGVGLGVTPLIGFRIGGYYTEGPYLGPSVEAMLPTGADWRDFDQRILGFELEFSRGYFELNGDLALSSYDVPLHPEASEGQAWFLEPKYSFTPRLFTALRLEGNDYPYIRPQSATDWLAVNAKFYDLELGVGWRFTPGLLLKASGRFDRWEVDPSRAAFFPNGYAVGLQLSYSFDVRSWFESPR